VAAERGQRFAEAHGDAAVDALIVLQAPARARFDGRRVWDALGALGLEWGDMDVFHWPNPTELGDDALFDVWTSTPPGYFLPEEIQAGRLHVEDLVFGFRIARCPDPHAVLSQMVEAARFAQRQLGGRLLDEHEQPYDETAGQAQVRQVLDRLAQAGLRPGESTTLRLF
jgi:cell division protein ZipA